MLPGDPNPNLITFLSVPLSGGAGVGGSTVPNVNVTPTSHDLTTDTPEIRKYKKRFYSEILCAKILLGVILRVSFKLKFESTVQLFVTKESQ